MDMGHGVNRGNLGRDSRFLLARADGKHSIQTFTNRLTSCLSLCSLSSSEIKKLDVCFTNSRERSLAGDEYPPELLVEK